MKVTNKKTGKDITRLYIKLLSGEITNKKLEQLKGLTKKQKQDGSTY